MATGHEEGAPAALREPIQALAFDSDCRPAELAALVEDARARILSEEELSRPWI